MLPKRQFSIRLLLAMTTAIAVGFASPLMPLIYLVNIILFTSVLAIPVVLFWLAATPVAQWRESMGAASRVFGLAIVAFATLMIMIFVRMEFMGHDF